MSMTEMMIDIPTGQEKNIFGEYDSYIKLIEKAFQITVIARNGACKLLGNESAMKKGANVLQQLIELAIKGTQISEQTVSYAITLEMENDTSSLAEMDSNLICTTISGKPIKPKTLGQEKYYKLMKERMIVFGIGPAGTGKTYLAMAMEIGRAHV